LSSGPCTRPELVEHRPERPDQRQCFQRLFGFDPELSGAAAQFVAVVLKLLLVSAALDSFMSRRLVLLTCCSNRQRVRERIKETNSTNGAVKLSKLAVNGRSEGRGAARAHNWCCNRRRVRDESKKTKNHQDGTCLQFLSRRKPDGGVKIIIDEFRKQREAPNKKTSQPPSPRSFNVGSISVNNMINVGKCDNYTQTQPHSHYPSWYRGMHLCSKTMPWVICF
jgi:hypothetical protein